MTATLPRTGAEPDIAPSDERIAVVVRWHALRRVAGAVTTALAVFSGIILLWPAMVIVAVLGAGIALDATLALRSHRSSVGPTLVADITFTGVAVVAAAVPPAAVGVVVAYFVLVIAVVATDVRIWPVGGYAVAVGALASYLSVSIDTAGDTVERSLAAGVITIAVFGISTVAMLREFAVVRSRGRRTVGRRIEVADAVAQASRTLLAEDDSHALGSALDVVREAMGVTVVFVERNLLDPTSGLVAVVEERSVDPSVAHPTLDVRSTVPWSAMPGARAHLEGGAPFFYRVEEARGTVADRGGEGGLHVEVNIPIRSGDEWLGVVGAADTDTARLWRTDDLALLRTMADLTGAFWQRARDEKVRDALIGTLDGRLRYEEAIANASRALLGEHASDMAPALDAVGTAAGVDEVFITRTVPDELGDPAAEVIDAWVAVGLSPSHPVGATWSYADRPAVQRSIQRGEMARTTRPGLASELIAGIEVSGAWFGTVGFVADDRHQWSARDEGFVRTFADMVGAFYERRQNRSHLQDSLESRDQLIATVSHELRTPLTAVHGLASELRTAGDTFDVTERAQLLAVIEEESSEMADLIEDLLVAARSDGAALPVFPERIDLSLLSRTVVDHLSIPDGHHVEVDDTASVAWADPVRVRQVVRNLVTNAIRYGGPAIRISFGSDGAFAWADVHDDGAGIPEGDRGTVFEPYGRSSNGKRVTASVGLGLALSRRLARLMDGELSLLRGEGCTFRLTVPLPRPDDR